MKFLFEFIKPASPFLIESALCFLRVSMGILSIGHGYPKLMGGMQSWKSLGMLIQNVGFTFWPTIWGFLGASIEFFGGILLIIGLGTRFASLCLVLMMVVAAAFHIQKGDSFQVYSFSISLMTVFITFLLVGGGKYSLDYYLINS